MIDYRDLLTRYIQHVGQCEGVTYTDKINDGFGTSDVKFTPVEVTELHKLESEAFYRGSRRDA